MLPLTKLRLPETKFSKSVSLIMRDTSQTWGPFKISELRGKTGTGQVDLVPQTLSDRLSQASLLDPGDSNAPSAIRVPAVPACLSDMQSLGPSQDFLTLTLHCLRSLR